MRRSAHLTLGAVLALGFAALGGVTLARPASAATPGSACTIYIFEDDILEGTHVEIAHAGTVTDTEVSYCVPNVAIAGLGSVNLNVLGGVCGEPILVGLGLSIGRTECPN